MFIQLAVHVGMDTSSKAIFLEQCGKNRGYLDSDVRGFQPEDGVCLPGGPEVMLSVVNMKEVCRRVAVEDVEVAFSRDAGRYFRSPRAKQVEERDCPLESLLFPQKAILCCPCGCFGHNHLQNSPYLS